MVTSTEKTQQPTDTTHTTAAPLTLPAPTLLSPIVLLAMLRLLVLLLLLRIIVLLLLLRIMVRW